MPFFLVSLLTVAGYKLGNKYDLVNRYLGPVSKIVLLISLIIFFLLWVVNRRLRQAPKLLLSPRYRRNFRWAVKRTDDP